MSDIIQPFYTLNLNKNDGKNWAFMSFFSTQLFAQSTQFYFET